MKTILRLLVLLLISVAIAIGLYFINIDLIENSSVDVVLEIAVVTLPVFIVLSLLYMVNRALVRTAKRLRKKKPSGQEGSNS